MPKARIRNHVRRLREQRGLTQTELARCAGCTRQTVIMLEQERYVPSLSLAFDIARCLGETLEAVFVPVRDETPS
ncbi:MAG: helix-turn-helix transcriptional regulator [Bacteroidota bacterium]|nr:helix-turn-helix transcriptional regulator [Bacteroidota bacterium]